MTGAACPHCQVSLSLAEVTDGWCESCGKRLPPSLLPTAIAWVERARKQEVLQKQTAFAGWVMAGITLGLAGLIASRLLFDMPRVHEPEKTLLPWLIGVPVGGGAVFSVLFLYLAKRHPRVVSIGFYLLHLACLLIACAVLVIGLAVHLFR